MPQTVRTLNLILQIKFVNVNDTGSGIGYYFSLNEW